MLVSLNSEEVRPIEISSTGPNSARELRDLCLQDCRNVYYSLGILTMFQLRIKTSRSSFQSNAKLSTSHPASSNSRWINFSRRSRRQSSKANTMLHSSVALSSFTCEPSHDSRNCNSSMGDKSSAW